MAFKLAYFIALASLAVASAEYTDADMQPFSCSNDLYVGLFSPTCLKSVDNAGDLTVIRDPIDGLEYNAMGYNRQDNFIYASRRGAVKKSLIRIDKDGDWQTVMPLAMLSHIGDVDEHGNYWYSKGCTMRAVNIVTGVELLGSPWVMKRCCDAADLAFKKSDGFMYLLDHGDSTKFCKIDPSNPAEPIHYMDENGAEPKFPQYGGVGAFFFDGDDNAYLYRNKPGTLYKVNIDTGALVMSYDKPRLSQSDGCSCVDMEGPPDIGPPAGFDFGDDRCTGYVAPEPISP